MKKLKNKVFFTIILILTLSIISLLLIVNINNYIEEKGSVKNSLETAISRSRGDNASIPGATGAISGGKQQTDSAGTSETPSGNTGKALPGSSTSGSPSSVAPGKDQTPAESPDISSDDASGKSRSSGTGKESDTPADGSDIRFVDSVIYTVLLNEDDSIRDVINHSDNGLSDTKIKKIASGILEGIAGSGEKTSENSSDNNNSSVDTAAQSDSDPGSSTKNSVTSSQNTSSVNDKMPEDPAKNTGNTMIRQTGNLYFADNSYIYIPGNSLTIFDNSTVSDSLWHMLRISALIFVIMELLFIAAAKLLTAWIIKPVQQSFDRQKQFIADASHELKTPLSVIMACSEMLEDDPGRTKWLRNIRTEADRMNTLIMDLLRLASSEQDEQLPMQNGDLSHTVELAALTFDGKAFESGVTLECDITPGIMLDMHENSIRQLVEILLDNAVKHSDSGQTVRLALDRQHGRPQLSVTNKGDAIPAGEEEKIFERFYRSDASRDRSEGRFGLGLAIARNIVNAHHGNITAASAEGLTTFTVRL